MDLVRLAIPRRVYTQSHIDYVAEAVIDGGATRPLDGLSHHHSAPVLRHFTARFEPLTAERWPDPSAARSMRNAGSRSHAPVRRG